MMHLCFILPQMINLTIHGIGTPVRQLEDGEETVWLNEDAIHSILDRLIHYKEYTITVDDANQSDADILLPALLSRGLKAIFFISAGFLGRKGYLTKEQVKIISRAGMEIGTHGMFHRDLRGLNHSHLNSEIYESKYILQEITGEQVKKISCPLGSYDRRVLRYLRNADFDKVYTSDRGLAKADWWIQPRNSFHNTDNMQTLSLIMTQPHSLRDSFISRTKRLIKRLR